MSLVKNKLEQVKLITSRGLTVVENLRKKMIIRPDNELEFSFWLLSEGSYFL